MVTSAQNMSRLQEAVKTKGVPLYVISAEIRAATSGKCKLDPGDLGKIVKGILIPTVGQKIGIATALGKSVSELFGEEAA
jgi:hypothetical protein